MSYMSQPYKPADLQDWQYKLIASHEVTEYMQFDVLSVEGATHITAECNGCDEYGRDVTVKFYKKVPLTEKELERATELHEKAMKKYNKELAAYVKWEKDRVDKQAQKDEERERNLYEKLKKKYANS